MGSTIVTSGSSGLFPGHTFIFEATFTMTFTLCAIRSARLSAWYRSGLCYQWYTFVPQITSFQPLFWSSCFDLSPHQLDRYSTLWKRQHGSEKERKPFNKNLLHNVFFIIIPGQRGMSFTSQVIKGVPNLCLLRVYVSCPLTHKFQNGTVFDCVHSVPAPCVKDNGYSCYCKITKCQMYKRWLTQHRLINTYLHGLSWLQPQLRPNLQAVKGQNSWFTCILCCPIWYSPASMGL